ncbi:CDC27 family protein [Winogradskyella sp.]|uniref:CDC27 family protein n=1 Tax=Winogradskyella sp. TaxID=1883156 RepID=UPI0025EF37F0|nr:CDC27 family protein [Winogradskyella sp.]
MNKDELIANYISKTLSLEAKKEFDHLLATDSEFAKEVAFQNNLKAVIKKEERKTVKQQLRNFEAEGNSSFNYRNWFVAATVIALLGLTSFWYFNSSIDAEKLYAENFEPYRNVVQPIVRGETKTDLKTKAFTAYETKKYTEALLYFNELLKENSDETIAFYKANVLLKLNKTEEAITILENNLKTTDSLDAKNNWYLALAHLRLNDIENSKMILNELDTSTLFKNKEVRHLLKQLD